MMQAMCIFTKLVLFSIMPYRERDLCIENIKLFNKYFQTVDLSMFA